jgi:hypothetical protein
MDPMQDPFLSGLDFEPQPPAPPAEPAAHPEPEKMPENVPQK